MLRYTTRTMMRDLRRLWFHVGVNQGELQAHSEAKYSQMRRCDAGLGPMAAGVGQRVSQSDLSSPV